MNLEQIAHIKLECLKIVEKRNSNLSTEELIKEADKLFRFIFQ